LERSPTGGGDIAGHGTGRRAEPPGKQLPADRLAAHQPRRAAPQDHRLNRVVTRGGRRLHRDEGRRTEGTGRGAPALDRRRIGQVAVTLRPGDEGELNRRPRDGLHGKVEVLDRADVRHGPVLPAGARPVPHDERKRVLRGTVDADEAGHLVVHEAHPHRGRRFDTEKVREHGPASQ
jgi:hypothetical protein